MASPDFVQVSAGQSVTTLAGFRHRRMVVPIDFDGVTPEEWDTARRAADAVNLHVSALGSEAHGRYVAIRLSDGRSDGVLYDSQAQAIQYQPHPDLCAYARIDLTGTTPKKMWVFIVYMRQLYENGTKFSEESPRLTLLSEDVGKISPRLGRILRPGRMF